MSQLLTQALQIAQTHKEPSLRICRLASVAKLYAEAGQIEQASELFSLALQSAQVLECYKKSSVLSDIAIKLAAAGQLDRALMVTQSIEESYSLEEVLEVIGLKLTQLEHIHQALTISLSLEKGYQRSSVVTKRRGDAGTRGHGDSDLVGACTHHQSAATKSKILVGDSDPWTLTHKCVSRPASRFEGKLSASPPRLRVFHVENFGNKTGAIMAA